MEIDVFAIARGSQINPQDLDDEDFTMVIDKANAFAFKIDDIEEAHSHVDFMEKATNRAGYRLADNHDQEVLAYLSGYAQVNPHEVGSVVNTEVNGSKAVTSAGSDELLASMKLTRPDFAGQLTTDGTVGDSIPVGPRLPGATSLPATFVSPVQLVNRMAARLNKQFVDSDGRWLVINPDFLEVLQDEDSRFLNVDFGQSGALRSGEGPTMIQGFKVYLSNNLPQVGTGSGTSTTADQDANYGVLVAGHTSSVATAEQINKTESFRDPNSFGDVVRGMHLYGRKILRPEAIVTARFNVAF